MCFNQPSCKMPNNLEEAIEEFRKYSECAGSIYNDTLRCYEDMKAEEKLRKYTVEVIFPSAEIEETGRALKITPSVVFTGERNCGKSSILNGLLRKSYLPIQSTPCTSRIVKISDSPDRNTFRVVSKAGIEVQPVKPFCSEGVRNCVVVTDQRREHQHELNSVVEIKLNHPLLKSGIELIDSPGRNECDALDDVLDGFFTKGTTPLIVYVIDGNQQLRPSDREAIRGLQQKCPHVSFLFVCNKVDVCDSAKNYDDRQSSSDDSEDGGEKEQLSKAKTVFDQLQRYGYLPENESFDSCLNFHGISSRKVRKERMSNQKGKATEMFEKFETCLLNSLEKTVKWQTNQVIGKLLSTLSKFIGVVNEERGHLARKKAFSELDVNVTLDAGNSFFSELTTMIANEEKVQSLVKCNLINIEETCLREADHFRPEKTDWRTHEVKSLLKNTPGFTKSSPSFYSSEVHIPSFQLLAVVKGVILDKAFNVLRCVVNAHLHGTKSDVVQRLAKHRRLLPHLIVQTVLDDVYEPARSRSPDELMTRLEEVASGGLWETLSTILNDGLSSVASECKSPTLLSNIHTERGRRKVVGKILSSFTPEKVAEAITEACSAHLRMTHRTFVQKAIEMKITTTSDTCLKEFKELGILYIPRVKYLAMRAFALKFSLWKGNQLTMGPLVKSTKHGNIFSCSGWPKGTDTKPMAVKIVEKKNVDSKIWEQTASDLIHSWEIQRMVKPTCNNLLYLYGWLIPKPGTIQIVTERADCDLTTALQGGLSLKIRMKIAKDVANGIKAIHSANYIDQDIKADSLLLMEDATAKINMGRPEKPFETTRQGAPFHISLEMHRDYPKHFSSCASYDVYAFGALLWVLCEGSGLRRPQAYDNYCTVEAMKIAVEKNIFPERPSGATDACWKLMTKCWKQRHVVTIQDVLSEMTRIYTAV